MATAAVTARDALFTTVCVESDVIGYEWHDGAWSPAQLGQFRFRTHTLQKRDATSQECADAIKAVEDLLSDASVGCYTMTVSGKAPGQPIACDETWDAAADGSKSLTAINCNSAATSEWIVLEPSGTFDYASTGGAPVGPGDDVKEPIILSVGSCSTG
jgi:hypothetical protein